MGERAAQEGNLLQAGQFDVVNVAAAAAQEPDVLLAQDARADALAFPVRIDHCAFPIRCHVPDAVQRERQRSGAPLIRNLHEGGVRTEPGSAAHHSPPTPAALRCPGHTPHLSAHEIKPVGHVRM